MAFDDTPERNTFLDIQNNTVTLKASSTRCDYEQDYKNVWTKLDEHS